MLTNSHTITLSVRYKILATVCPSLPHGTPNKLMCSFLVGIIDILDEDSNGFNIGLSLKFIATLLQNQTKLGGVGDNTIVYNDEVRGGIRSDRMVAINL